MVKIIVVNILHCGGYTRVVWFVKHLNVRVLFSLEQDRLNYDLNENVQQYQFEWNEKELHQ